MTETTEKRRRNPGLVGPILLIAAGILFLLNNLGLVGWDVWTLIARFWPLILIGIGLDILLGARSRGLVLAVVLLAGVVLWFGWNRAPAGQRAATVETISQGTEGAERAEIHLAPGVAALTVEPADDSDVLVEGTVGTGRGERLEQDFSLSGDRAVYRLESEQDRSGFPFFSNNEGRDWDLRLNADLPMVLNVDAGVGRVELDLEDFNLTELHVNAGVGETVVTLPESGRIEADIRTGVGRTVVRIPREMAARIRASRGIGGISVNGDFERQGELYVSPDYAGAENRVDLQVEGGVGEIDIETF